MEFTTLDIPDQKFLKHFIRSHVNAKRHTVINGNFHAVYNTKKVIRVLELKIEKHSKGTNSTKYIPNWQSCIELLQGLKND